MIKLSARIALGNQIHSANIANVQICTNTAAKLLDDLQFRMAYAAADFGEGIDGLISGFRQVP
jgi:hypothetical protein